MNPLVKKCILQMTMFFGYALFGAWIFTLIEGKEKTNKAEGLRMLTELKNMMRQKYNITNSSEFDDIVRTVKAAMDSINQMDWDFLNACAFTITSITTIGYGYITPQTPGGRGFVIPFCLIGIPLAMIALKTGGEVLHLGLKNLTHAFEFHILRNKNPGCTLKKCLIISTINVSSFICIMAVVSIYLDGYTFLEGVYCWFVTFSTMGFGDFIPLREFGKQTSLSRTKLILCGMGMTIPYIMGLCLVACLLNVIVEFSKKKYTQIRAMMMAHGKIKSSRRNESVEAKDTPIYLTTFKSIQECNLDKPDPEPSLALSDMTMTS